MRCCHWQSRLEPEARQPEDQRPLQQPHPQEQKGLGPAWRTKKEENLRRWRSDDRAREKERQANTGERLTKRELNRPKQAYLYKTCVKQNTQETRSAREFLSLNPEGIWGVCTRWPPVRIFIICKTLKKEGRAFRNIGKNIYIFRTVKISLASFVL